jgi:hypothetical protein
LDLGLQNLGLSKKKGTAAKELSIIVTNHKKKKTATAGATLKERESVVLGHNYSYRNPGGEVSNKQTNHSIKRASEFVLGRQPWKEEKKC